MYNIRSDVDLNNEEALKIYFENLLSHVDYKGVREKENPDKDVIEANVDEIKSFEENFENIHCEDSVEEVTSFIIIDETISTPKDTNSGTPGNLSDNNILMLNDPSPDNENISAPDDSLLKEEIIVDPDASDINIEKHIEEIPESLLIEKIPEPLLTESSDEQTSKEVPLDLLEESQSSLLHFNSVLKVSLSILQRKNSHFLSSNAESSEFEHLSLILDFSNELKLNYTLSLSSQFDKITSIQNNISILKSYIIYHSSSNSYSLAIQGLLHKKLSLLYNNTTTEHSEKVPFEKVFKIHPSKPLQRFTTNKPIAVYPFNKKFLDEHKLCMNILKSNIRENFKIERKPI